MRHSTVRKRRKKQARESSSRPEVLSAGPKDDPSALAIKACDPSGQVIMLVSKLVPMPSSPGRFYAVGPPPKLLGQRTRDCRWEDNE